MMLRLPLWILLLPVAVSHEALDKRYVLVKHALLSCLISVFAPLRLRLHRDSSPPFAAVGTVGSWCHLVVQAENAWVSID